MTAVSLILDTPDLARHYEEASSDRQFKAGKALVAKLALLPGETVLDVGTGTGLLAEYVAEIVGPRGSVVGIDPLALRIDIAKNKTRPNLSFRVGDAGDLGT
jgi:arsenite methyltransferase